MAQCPGLRLPWALDTFWAKYPFQVHDPHSKYYPGYYFTTMSPPFIRSDRCLGSSKSAGTPCTWCASAAHDVEALRDRAEELFSYVRVEERYNHEQSLEKVAQLKEQVNDLKLETVNLKRSLASAREDVAEFHEIFQSLGTHSVPGLHRMFSNALMQKWGAKKFLEMITAAYLGDYTPRSYSQYDIDLAILLYEFGGASAVYARNHSIFALPSLSTLQPYRRQHRPKPCLDHVNVLTISENISTMFGPHDEKGGKACEAPTKICGHALMFDEIAIDPKVDYMSATDEMAGFCLEHVSALETLVIGKDTKTVDAAVAAVKEGKVHVAHEATVGAISHLSRHDYGAKPVFITPSCKKGGWQGMLETMQSTLEAWKHSPDGEAKHGPVLTVASDGDHARRVALFMLCMHSEVVEGNPLYPLICNLLGFNRRVGKDNIVMEMDYRHEFKRLCTLLCSAMGMLAKNVCVNRDLLVRWFERLTNHDWSEHGIENLLHPTDPQNVSRAIQLLLCIVEIRTIDKTDLDPTEEAEYEALCLLGEVFEALLQPFINPQLSLSQQITSLVTFAHLACGLYIQNSTSFMSNQLYGDLHTMIKAAIIVTTKTQLLDPLLDVLICLLGDNPVETLFGRSRMCGGHAPHCSISELLTRFTSAMNLDNVFRHHPELERSPRRLKLVRGRDNDHVSPTQWNGETAAGSCDIEQCYNLGIDAAEDLQWPFGGKYPALSSEIDRSMVNTSPSDVSDPDSSVNPVFEYNFDGRMALDKAQRAVTSDNPHSIFAVIESGQQYPKTSIVRVWFQAHSNHSSHDRIQRVRCFSVGGKTWHREETGSEPVFSLSHFQLGDLFASFVCYNGTHVGLALAKTTLIKRGPPGGKSPSISAIPIAELTLPASPFTICGQIFSLLPLKKDGSEWVWDGKFVSLSVKKKGKSGADDIDVSRLRILQLSNDRRDVFISELESADTENLIDFNSERAKTWVFSQEFILAAWYRLKERIEKDIYEGVTCAFSIVDTPIFDALANRQACRVCGKIVKDTDIQNHMGKHIRKALRNVHEEFIKCPCPLHCEEMQWKYNFPRHLEERHPSWRSLISPTFIQQITVTRAEELALDIPEGQAIFWPPLEPPSSPVCGQKRTNPLSPRSPRRLQCKDNQNGNKVPRLFLKIPGLNSARRASAVSDKDDVFM
ncbi:hypothetical protein K438DRAFT_2074070 [Mycena galopus ATCC 62051]|nr:hypothetical protein K438DRAFT_2074070 [Mycena galopus ATCC 62051]